MAATWGQNNAIRALATLAYNRYRGTSSARSSLNALVILESGIRHPAKDGRAPGPAPWATPSSCPRATAASGRLRRRRQADIWCNFPTRSPRPRTTCGERLAARRDLGLRGGSAAQLQLTGARLTQRTDDASPNGASLASRGHADAGLPGPGDTRHPGRARRCAWSGVPDAARRTSRSSSATTMPRPVPLVSDISPTGSSAAGPSRRSWPDGRTGMSRKDTEELQTLLTRRGFDTGEPTARPARRHGPRSGPIQQASGVSATGFQPGRAETDMRGDS